MENIQKINDTTISFEKITPEVVIPEVVIPAKTETVTADINFLVEQEKQIKKDYQNTLMEATQTIQGALSKLDLRSKELAEVQTLLTKCAELGIINEVTE